MHKILSNNKGISIVELIVVISIFALLVAVTMYTFITYKKSQAFTLDVQKIVSVLNQARSQTLFSKDATVYGVHFTSNSATLFSGSSYSPGASGNEMVPFATSDISISRSLSGGGDDVIFNRLTGETDQNGTVTISSASTGENKTVTIYKTGLVDF